MYKSTLYNCIYKLLMMEFMIAILGIICLCYCCCRCCYWYARKTKSLDYDVEKGEQKYHMKKLANLRDNGNSVGETDEIHRGSHYNRAIMYNEDEVVQRAQDESGTLLWTNNGQVFINHPGGDHAEILFISNNSNPKNSISTIYIENSPCHSCSNALKKYFSSCYFKPTIQVGKIWHLDNEEDKKGLRILLEDGFKIEVWHKLHNRKYGYNTKTSNYLRELKNSMH